MAIRKHCMSCAFAALPHRMEPCKGCSFHSNWQPIPDTDAISLEIQRAAEEAMHGAMFRPGGVVPCTPQDFGGIAEVSRRLQAAPQAPQAAPQAPQAAPLDSLDAMEGVKECPDLKPLTGGSSDYYKVAIADPTTPGTPAYTAECNDIIEALKMDYALGNIFKAVWRIAKSRLGSGKSGTTTLYDAEKVAFFGNRLVSMEKAK